MCIVGRAKSQLLAPGFDLVQGMYFLAQRVAYANAAEAVIFVYVLFSQVTAPIEAGGRVPWSGVQWVQRCQALASLGWRGDDSSIVMCCKGERDPDRNLRSTDEGGAAIGQ